MLTIYNPKNGDEYHEEKILNAISSVLGEDAKQWRVRRCTSLKHQIRKEESGVFVAAWIKSISEIGDVNNCIGVSQVKLFRSKIYNDLKIRNYGKAKEED